MELDELLPEAAERAKRQREAYAKYGVEAIKGKRTHFGHYPDCQDVADAFLDYMGWMPDPFTIKQVAAGARDFVAVFGNNYGLLVKTLRHIERNEPEVWARVASPRSCITHARRMGKKEAMTDEERRRRYLNGTE